MKQETLLALTVGTTFGLAGAAMADQHDPALDQVLEIPDFTLGPEPDTFSYIAEIEPNNNPVVGFTFQGDWTATDGAPWASDTRLDIFPPDGQTGFSVGGFGGDQGEAEWDFQGPDSADPGTYTSQHFPDAWADGITKGGEWEFLFTNTFGTTTGHEWTNVTITLHKVPAPGALALLGMAGVIGCRRRRRS